MFVAVSLFLKNWRQALWSSKDRTWKQHHVSLSESTESKGNIKLCSFLQVPGMWFVSTSEMTPLFCCQSFFSLQISQMTARHESSVNLIVNSGNMKYVLQIVNKVQVLHARATHNPRAAPPSYPSFPSSLPAFYTFDKMGVLRITHITFTIPVECRFCCSFCRSNLHFGFLL